MQELVGQTIRSVAVEAGHHQYLRFVVAGRDGVERSLYYYSEGDCCSWSWFADITGVSLIRGQEVLSVEEIDLDEDEHGCEKYYGIKIITPGGVADIIFRNSSNGYYGGWVKRVDLLRTGAELIAIDDQWAA